MQLSTSESSSTKSLKELALISELNPNPILELDANGSVVYCNRAADALFPEIRQQSKDHEFLVGFDSALRILLTVGASIARDVSVGSEWYHQTIHRVGAGSSVRVYAVNITDRKAVEFSRELLSTAVTKSKDWIYITDANGTIEYVNDSVTIGCGYSREELIGATPSIWKSGFHGEDFYAELWRDILGSKPFIGIFVNRKKDGTRFSLDQTITPITDVAGVITSFAATGRDITQKAELEKRINYLSYYDVLTGLPNRHLFLDRLKRTLLAAERHQKVIAILVLDLDRFKFINDVQGSEVGDSMLRSIADGLSQAVYERDTVCRFGNDEFGIAAEVSRVEDVVSLVKKIQNQIAASLDLTSGAAPPTASIGVSVFPDDGNAAESLITNADLALAQAKLEGRSGYHFFTSRLNERISEFVTMEKQLSAALDRDEFTLHYQPCFACGSGNIVAMEALIRWHRSSNEIVSPGLFIPVLEDSRLIGPVGEWVISQVCTQIATWKDRGLGVVPVSVNLSPVQFSLPGLLDRIAQIVSDRAIDPSLLVFEVTESTAMRDAEYTRELLSTLKARGFDISIDDFGTGYSSLSYLKRFPIDNLKIDQSFVKTLSEDPEDAVLVETMITMAHHLNLKVIAEGVESGDHLEKLREFNCDVAQGYHCAKPAPATEAEAFLIGNLQDNT